MPTGPRVPHQNAEIMAATPGHQGDNRGMKQTTQAFNLHRRCSLGVRSSSQSREYTITPNARRQSPGEPVPNAPLGLFVVVPGPREVRLDTEDARRREHNKLVQRPADLDTHHAATDP